ncbi:MAG: biopolymer transporter ExbD [Parachlamydia sp.]|nr:MAG: biopolymer transporter ExbD [Parachlamydia sp.]
MGFKTNLKTSHNLIDLTPLVDVIFLMLIFFIITSDILPLKSLNIQNPTLEKDSAPLTTQLLVVVDAQNVLYVGSKKMIVDFGSLKATLQEEIASLRTLHPQHLLTVVLSIDRRVDYGSFLKVFAIAQECCSSIRLVYKPVDADFNEYL